MMTVMIDYIAGDSEKQWKEKDEVACVWMKREKVEKALEAINEHADFYRRLELAYNPNEQLAIFEEVKSKSWYVEGKNGQGKPFWNANALIVEKDDGEPHHIDAFWCGVFESLVRGKIVTSKQFKNKRK